MKGRRFSLHVVLAWIVLLFLIVPSLVSLPVSVTNENYLSLPHGAISWKHFANLFSSPEWMTSFLQSGIVAACSSALATVAGTLCAVGLWRLSSKLGEAIRAVLLLPLIIPSIISAMAFYRLWIPLHLIDTYPGLILAHSILALPMVLITVSASLANFDLRLEQASRSLGAPMAVTIRRVILPSIRPGILAGAVFAFILSWDEIVVALFISKFSVFTLPRRLWNGMRENTDPTVAAAAVILIATTLTAMLAYNLLANRSSRSASR